MDEEFLATLKLMTGEEIVAKVCYLEDEDKVLLENPLQVESAKQRKGQLEVSGFSFKEWIFCQIYQITRSFRVPPTLPLIVCFSKLEHFVLTNDSGHNFFSIRLL